MPRAVQNGAVHEVNGDARMNSIAPIQALLRQLGDEINDVDEETFSLFIHSNSTQDLGMLAPKASEIEVSIGGRDFTIKQSPGILNSNRSAGTTGAVVWRVSVLLAEWLSSAQNALFETNVLNHESAVVELGAGISGLIASSLVTRVKRMVATDQGYALKLLRENVDANQLPSVTKNTSKNKHKVNRIENEVLALDWETDSIAGFLKTHEFGNGVDALIVCDCVFNYALIEPLVSTCKEVCRARAAEMRANEGEAAMPTLCLVAQQLRQPDVFEQWLRTFSEAFRVWRLPDNVLSKALKEGSGFVVHVGILR